MRRDTWKLIAVLAIVVVVWWLAIGRQSVSEALTTTTTLPDHRATQTTERAPTFGEVVSNFFESLTDDSPTPPTTITGRSR